MIKNEKKTWFDNTIFVFISDHGINEYELMNENPLNAQIPFIIYSPKIITNPQINNIITSQVDVVPTLLHLIGYPESFDLMGSNILSDNYNGVACRIVNDYSMWFESDFLYTEIFNQETAGFRYSDLYNYPYLSLSKESHLFKLIQNNFHAYLQGAYTYYKNRWLQKCSINLISEWKIEKDKKLILLPGRLTTWKGQEMFIEALSLVNKELPSENFYAVILGNDQGRKVYKKKLVRLVEQHRLTKQVKFIDRCTIMPVAYKISDLIVSSSIEEESFGRVSVEAQSMEKPIVASNIGGSVETIINNKTGFLFESGKPDSLCKKIIEVLQLDETTLKFLGNEGRKNVVKKFNIEKMCDSTYSEYKKLIS